MIRVDVMCSKLIWYGTTVLCLAKFTLVRALAVLVSLICARAGPN